MPESTVVTPAAAVPADRLTLGCADVRTASGLASLESVPSKAGLSYCNPPIPICMADE